MGSVFSRPRFPTSRTAVAPPGRRMPFSLHRSTGGDSFRHHSPGFACPLTSSKTFHSRVSPFPGFSRAHSWVRPPIHLDSIIPARPLREVSNLPPPLRLGARGVFRDPVGRGGAADLDPSSGPQGVTRPTTYKGVLPQSTMEKFEEKSNDSRISS